MIIPLSKSKRILLCETSEPSNNINNNDNSGNNTNSSNNGNSNNNNNEEEDTGSRFIERLINVTGTGAGYGIYRYLNYNIHNAAKLAKEAQAQGVFNNMQLTGPALNQLREYASGHPSIANIIGAVTLMALGGRAAYWWARKLFIKHNVKKGLKGMNLTPDQIASEIQKAIKEEKSKTKLNLLKNIYNNIKGIGKNIAKGQIFGVLDSAGGVFGNTMALAGDIIYSPVSWIVSKVTGRVHKWWTRASDLEEKLEKLKSELHEEQKKSLENQLNILKNNPTQDNARQLIAVIQELSAKNGKKDDEIIRLIAELTGTQEKYIKSEIKRMENECELHELRGQVNSLNDIINELKEAQKKYVNIKVEASKGFEKKPVLMRIFFNGNCIFYDRDYKTVAFFKNVDTEEGNRALIEYLNNEVLIIPTKNNTTIGERVAAMFKGLKMADPKDIKNAEQSNIKYTKNNPS